MENVAKILKHEKAGDNSSFDKRRDELDLQNEVIVTNNIPVDFVFIGDSITQKWELNSYFGRNGKILLNRGIGGDSSWNVMKRFAADVIQLKPNYAILEVGINDTWAIDGYGGDPQSVTNPWLVGEKILVHIGKMIELARDSQQKMIFAAIPPTGDIEWAPRKKDRNELVLKVNREIKKMACENECIFVDYHSGMVGEDGITLRENLSHDGVHPHVLGYNIMADILGKTLASNKLFI